VTQQSELARAVPVPLFIGGETVNSDGEPLELRSPATDELLSLVQQGTREDVGRAVAAAERAREPLERLTAFERAELCHRVADRLLERRDEIGRAIALEQGKPLRRGALDEVDVAAGMFRDAAECAKRLESTVYQSSERNKRILTLRQARGVYAILTPWNYPVAIPSEYLSAGLATGNPMVLKPSEWTPLCAWHLVQCIADACPPPGTINLVLGPPAEVGDELAGHPRVVAIGLTGSSRTGEIVARRAAGKPMLLELGGNGPSIVFHDANLEQAVTRIAFGCFENAGQICNSTERILVHESLHDAFIAGLVEQAQAVRLGSPLDEQTTMGPISNEPTASKMDEHLEDAVALGADVIHGGARVAGFPTRLYYQPTVIDGLTQTMKISAEETFGPVAPVMTFATEREALELANACQLGLNGSIFTRDLSRAIRVAERLQTGTVNINETSAYWQPHTPVGGFSGKRSGIGRIGGMQTLLEMTQTKTITIDIEEHD
jgi:acyl-CoA reductase-like NAD-dependent aldehyde dehydrogenase